MIEKMDSIGKSFCIQGTLLLHGILKRDLLMERRILFELTHRGFGGSFKFSGPQKYSFTHVYWPKKPK